MTNLLLQQILFIRQTIEDTTTTTPSDEYISGIDLTSTIDH